MMRTWCLCRWIQTVAAVLLLAGSCSSGQTADGLRYKIYYQCNGERVEVSYCRKDSDMAGMPPTKPQDDYCLVYYPDRPRRNGIMVQAAELRADIVKKLQACGALAGNQPVSVQPSTSVSGNAQAYVAQGNKYYEAKNYTAALQACKNAIALRPDSKTLVSAYYCVANSYQGLDQYPDNVLALQEALRLNPGDPDTYFGLGWGYYNLKQYPNALASFKEAARLKPSDNQNYYWIGETYRIGLKQSENALAPFREALRLEPNNARTNSELGYTYYDLKQYDKAVAAFQQTVRLKADYVDGWAGLGYACNELYDFDKAQAAFQQAVRLKPTDSRLQFYLGYSYAWSVDMGEKELLPKAIAAFKGAIRLKPDYVDAYSWLGSMYAENGRKEEALQVYKALLALNKTEAQKLLEEINKPVSSQRSSGTPASPTKTNTAPTKTPAQSVPSAQTTAQPNQPSSQPSAATPQARQLMVMGSLQESSGQSDKALEYFRRAIALNPDAGTLAEAYLYLGSLYDDRKEYDKAVLALREALRLKPVLVDEVHANYLLGMAYLGLGKKSQAMEVYKTLQSLDKAEADRLNRRIQESK